MTEPQAFLERHGANLSGVSGFLERQKRRRRQGWHVHVLYEQKGERPGKDDELVALGWREFAGGPEPDRTGQTEIDLDGL